MWKAGLEAGGDYAAHGWWADLAALLPTTSMCVLWGLQHVALLDTCSIGPSGMTINCSAARCASQGSKNKNALTATALRATTWESLPGAQ